MNKKYLIAGLTVVLMIVLAGNGFTTNHAVQMPTPDTSEIKEEDKAKQQSFEFSELQANYPQHPETCYATGDNPSLTIDPVDKTAIEEAAIMTIIDIPAGTKADIYYKNYEKGNFATGTIIYESTYGSYNFIAQNMKGISSDQDSWIVSKFVACKK